MPHTATARTTTRRPAAVGLLVISAALIGTLVYQSASSAASFSEERPPGARPAAPDPAWSSAPSLSEGRRVGDRGTGTENDGAVTEDDGALPDGVTVFDDQYRGVADLDPELLHALREAATAAAGDGIEFHVNSGWRSAEYQERLFREAVSRYGSQAEAARWVATAETSAHVSGDAVDIGSSDATAWLAEHGASYGLCQVYRNETWHYELRPEARDRGCPPMLADSAHGRSAQP